jgi:hypothetical protein
LRKVSCHSKRQGSICCEIASVGSIDATVIIDSTTTAAVIIIVAAAAPATTRDQHCGER